MDRELQFALRARLRRLQALRPEALINGVGELADDLDDVGLMLALDEAELLDDDPSDSGGRDALVGAPLKPRPHLNSGAIALPEPDEPDR
jgi:hypothetical protein